MPGENVYDWSVVAADNATADSLINWQEGQARATVNNSARSEMAAVAKLRNLITGAITIGGTATAMTFVSGVGYTAVPNPMRVLLKVGATNGPGTTLNMDGIGAVAIKTQRGTDLVGGEMVLNSYAELIYNGANWILVTSVAAAVRTVQKFTGGSGTYTTPAGVKWIEIEMVGGGGGGAGTGPSGGASSPTNGGASCWNTTGAACTSPVYSAGGGIGGSSGGGVSGSSTPYLAVSGGAGCAGSPADLTDHHGVGGNGADSYFGGGGRGGIAATGGSAIANTGSGGAGGAIVVGINSANSGTGGGAGAYLRAIITQPAATYTYAVGASGGGGGGSGGGQSGGNGAAGMIIVHEFY